MDVLLEIRRQLYSVARFKVLRRRHGYRILWQARTRIADVLAFYDLCDALEAAR